MEHAQKVAIAALSWIAADGEQINRFVELSGVDPSMMRQAAAEPGFLAGVLDYLMGHEPTLLRFCEDNDLRPEDVVACHHALSGGVSGLHGDGS